MVTQLNNLDCSIFINFKRKGTMAGTLEGGRKAAKTIKERHGKGFYANIGRKGGSKPHPETRPFTKNPELARAAGAIGGKISRRGPAKDTSASVE